MDILKARCRTHPVVSGTKRLRSNSFNCLEFAQCTLLIGWDYHIFFACIKRRQAFAKQTRQNRTNSILLTPCLSKPVLNIRLICSVIFRYTQRDPAMYLFGSTYNQMQIIQIAKLPYQRSSISQ